MTFRRLLTKLGWALAAVAVFAVSYYLGNRHFRPGRQALQAFELPTPVSLPAFRLEDEKGYVFTQHDFDGFWSFVMAGDLSQERACRPLLQRYVLAWNLLATQPALQRRTRVVFLHTGAPLPANTLRRRIHFYNPRFTAAQGAPEQRRPLLTALGVPAAEQDAGPACDPDRTVVGLVDPHERLLALFTGVTDPVAIARDLRFFQ